MWLKKLYFFSCCFCWWKKRLRELCFYAFSESQVCVYKLKLVDGFPLVQVKIKSTCLYSIRLVSFVITCKRRHVTRGVRFYLLLLPNQSPRLHHILFMWNLVRVILSLSDHTFGVVFFNKKFVLMWRKALPQKWSYGFSTYHKLSLSWNWFCHN